MYDLCYYSFYCSILKGKKHGTGEERASFVLATTVSVLVISLYFYCSVYFTIQIVSAEVASITIFCFCIINYYLHLYHFVRKNRYIKIVRRYDQLETSTKRAIGVIAWLIFFGSFVIFAWSGIRMSNLS
jgi:hypothetical protein